MDLNDYAAPQLFKLYSDILNQLRQRSLIRSINNPIADYGEHLVARALNLTLASSSNTGYDAVGEDGKRYEVKARRIVRYNSSRQLSAIRGLECGHFDFLAGVLFTEDFTVFKACLIPHDVVGQIGTYRTHVNATVVHLRDGVWEKPGVVDITARVIEAQSALA